MKHIFAFLLVASIAVAADPVYPVHRMKNGVQVYEAILTTHLPPEVWMMSDAEYHRFALKWNERAREANRMAAHPPSDHVRYATFTEGASSSQSRLGGGVGAGGFGGAGGYDGYYGALDQPQGSMGFQYGSGRPGNAAQMSFDNLSKSFTYEYGPWPTFNGGNVELLNPWVRPRKR
ncbi:MAG: hypothetical protein ACREHD_35050 [Pirellulales bacterium]